MVALHKIEIFSKQLFLYNTIQYEVYRDPGKGKVIADYIITTTPIAFILSVLNFLSIYVNDIKFVGKNVHRGHTYEQFL